MSTTWSMPEYLDNLVANLKARPGLDGVQLWSAPIAEDELELEAIAFIDINSDEESAALGDARREEEYIIEGVIEVNIAGMGDDVAKEARDRAVELMAEIESEIRSDPRQGLAPSVVRRSEVITINLRQRVREKYRRCLVEFDIQVHHRK